MRRRHSHSRGPFRLNNWCHVFVLSFFVGKHRTKFEPTRCMMLSCVRYTIHRDIVHITGRRSWTKGGTLLIDIRCCPPLFSLMEELWWNKENTGQKSSIFCRKKGLVNLLFYIIHLIESWSNPEVDRSLISFSRVPLGESSSVYSLITLFSGNFKTWRELTGPEQWRPVSAG